MAAACHAVMFALLVLLGFASPHLGAVYFAGLAAVGLRVRHLKALVASLLQRVALSAVLAPPCRWH